MITNEQKEELNIIFTERKRLTDNISHNVADMKNQHNDWVTESDIETAAARKKYMEYCESRLSLQKTDLMKLSIQKISDLMGLPRHVVSVKYNLFDNCGYCL